MGLLPWGVERTRRTLPWDAETLQPVSRKQLSLLHETLLRMVWSGLKTLEHTPGDDAKFWSEYAASGHLWPDMVAIQAHAKMQTHIAEGSNGISDAEDWVLSRRSDKYQLRYLAHRQLVDIAARHAAGPRASRRDEEESLIRLFMKCKNGLGVFAYDFGNALRIETSLMRRAMVFMYPPDRIQHLHSCGWDPFLGEPARSSSSPIFHLYPWRQADRMNEIFTSVPTGGAFAPENGLFLDRAVQKGLEHGIIAMIPDVGVDRSETDFKERVEEWWRNPVKEYQIVVIDAEHPEASQRFCSHGCARRNYSRLLDLDKHLLLFRSELRPDVRFMWWAFLSAVTVAAWRRKGHPTESVRINIAIRNAMRHWGTPQGLIDDKVVSAFLATIAESTESLLDDDQQVMMRHERNDLGVAVVAFERANALREDVDEGHPDHQYADGALDMFAYDYDDDDDCASRQYTSEHDGDIDSTTE